MDPSRRGVEEELAKEQLELKEQANDQQTREEGEERKVFGSGVGKYINPVLKRLGGGRDRRVRCPERNKRRRWFRS